ncbi:MAG: histidine kinase [Sphingomonadales bacterium]|nr:histidine kinase [Sphingomonadales bacterium]MBU3991505.1 CHASE3 domain-containing protein [Alphaproteobacteria bacterium]
MTGSATPTARHRWSMGPRLPSLILLAIAAAALLGGVVLIWQTISAERSQREQAERTSAVLQALREVDRTAVEAETGQRGYFITLDQRYLAPYITAREQYRVNLAHLRRLMGANISPRQRELLGDIARLNEAKFAELAETVADIRDGDLIDVRRRILSDEGQSVMERLRSAIRELETIEVAALRQASDKAATSEARILPALVVLLAFILLTLGLALVHIIRTADAEARAANAQELARARDRADLLSRELNHRIKNLFAVILAIVKMTGRDAPEARPAIDRISGRIHALLKAHEVTQGTSAHPSAALADLVDTALKPYQSNENAWVPAGLPVDLPERAVVPLGLVLHELTTNAVKYGAWANPGGRIDVSWRMNGDRLRLDWRETCSSPSPDADPGQPGFGSSLIDGSARQLGGTIERVSHPDGIVVRIEFPLGE